MRSIVPSMVLTAMALVLLGQGSALAAPYIANPTGDDLKKVKAREVLLDSNTLHGGKVNEFIAVGVIKAPWEKVLRYYADPDNTKKFQTAIKKLDIIAAPEEYRRRAKYEIGLPWPLGDRHFVLDVWAVPRDRYIEWKLVDGDIDENRGSYAVTPWGENLTLVSYRLQMGLNTWLPAPILNWAQRGAIPNVILKAREDLE